MTNHVVANTDTIQIYFEIVGDDLRWRVRPGAMEVGYGHRITFEFASTVTAEYYSRARTEALANRENDESSLPKVEDFREALTSLEARIYIVDSNLFSGARRLLVTRDRTPFMEVTTSEVGVYPYHLAVELSGLGEQGASHWSAAEGNSTPVFIFRH